MIFLDFLQGVHESNITLIILLPFNLAKVLKNAIYLYIDHCFYQYIDVCNGHNLRKASLSTESLMITCLAQQKYN